jgi:hypothetical protein
LLKEIKDFMNQKSNLSLLTIEVDSYGNKRTETYRLFGAIPVWKNTKRT